MTNSELLKAKFEELLAKYAAKLETPSWFINSVKTALSKNITIEDWNLMYNQLKTIASENKVTLDILTEVMVDGFIKDLYDIKLDKAGGEITGNLIAHKGIQVPSNYGFQNLNTLDGIHFGQDGSLVLKNTKGLVLSLLANASNFDVRNYTFPDEDGVILIASQIQALLDKKFDKAGGTITGNTDVNGNLSANGGIFIPINFGIKNTQTENGIFFALDGTVFLANENGTILRLSDINGDIKNYTFPAKNGNVWLEEDIKNEHKSMTTDLIPDADTIRNLGGVWRRWLNVYADAIKSTSVKIGDYYAITERDKAELQSQIDGINAGQNLADIVGTYSALTSYDTSNLHVNDKVQVLVDETKENDSTVYKWNGSVFLYIGSYGSNAYTKAESDALHLKLDERMSQHEKDIALQFEKHEEDVQDQIDTYTENVKAYVDTSVGDIPRILDYLIEVSE